MRIFDSDLANTISVMRVPAIPGVLARLIGLCQAEHADLASYAQLIALDPGLTSKLLQAASSSDAGAELASVAQAVDLLGLKMIQTLIISESVTQSFNENGADRIDLRYFWRQSVTTAVIARMLADRTGYPRIEEAYLAGLLHDIGRLALLATYPNDYASLFSQSGAALCVKEQKLLRFTHVQAGAKLAEDWKLDSFLSDSILYHHEAPARLAKSHPLIRLVAVAYGLAQDGPVEPVFAACVPLLDVPAAELLALHASAVAEVIGQAQLISIDFSRTAETPVMPGPAFSAPRDDNGRAALSSKVSNLVLVTQARQRFNCDMGQAGLLKSVLHTARMLFSCRRAIILQRDASGEAFHATLADQFSRAVSEFSVPIQGGGTLMENALGLRLCFIDQSSSLLGIAELQALRLLQAESLVCLPFGSGGECCGILLLGLDAITRHALHERQGLLEAFGQQVGTAFGSLTSGEDELSRRIEAVSREFQAKAQRAAHEVNNPLAIIQNYFAVLERKLAKHELAGAEIPLLREEVERIVDIVQGLSEFKPAAAKNSLTDLRSVVQNIVQLFTQTEFLPSTVTLSLNAPDEPIEIDTDVDMLKQILINLIKNAVEALATGGQIKLDINGRLANRDGQLYVTLSVRDSGSGIPEEVMARLFSPVQSSKGAGNRGLGLSIVNQLVKTIGGFITCHSDQKGTSFEILLPVSTPVAKAPVVPKYATRTALSL